MTNWGNGCDSCIILIQLKAHISKVTKNLHFQKVNLWFHIFAKYRREIRVPLAGGVMRHLCRSCETLVYFSREKYNLINFFRGAKHRCDDTPRPLCIYDQRELKFLLTPFPWSIGFSTPVSLRSVDLLIWWFSGGEMDGKRDTWVDRMTTPGVVYIMNK